jgi:Protein of unknown function (DUF3300)
MRNQLTSPSHRDRPRRASTWPPREGLVLATKRALALALSTSLVLANASAYANTTSYSQPVTSTSSAPQQASAQLQQLVAPIALYPDPLVAQILAASTYPAEVVEADRWLEQHRGLKGQQLANEVNKQSWDPSVKAITEFPSVLANMDRNLSWTSSLGEAYVNQPQNVMNAVQDMRRRAQSSGQLQSTPQQRVTTQGQTIEIQPANPEVVYVPEYDPWLAYGPPVAAWPGWYPYPGLYVATPGIAFGIGIGVGLFAGFAWGVGHWGFNWAHRTVVFNHNTFVSHNAFSHRAFNHNTFAHGMHSGFNHRAVARSSAAHGGPAGGFHHVAGGFHHFAGGFHGGGFHGGGFHGGGFHGGRR